MASMLDPPVSGLPAVLGGQPAFAERLAFVLPRVPEASVVAEDVKKILTSGLLTNGQYVRELEERAAEYLLVKHCVAVSSCTAGLMLVLRCAELTGDVILPSFTFAATAHAVEWNGLRPVFADIDPTTLTLSPGAVRAVMGVRSSAILATHLYGTPCDIEGLTSVANDNGIRLFFDAAHAFGSKHRDSPIGGFGDAEVFSLSPTKVLVAGEGGIISTNDDVLAEQCRLGRDYGNPGNYDCQFVGLNARMSEVHAAIALASLEQLDERVESRNTLAAQYRRQLGQIPGLSFPHVQENDRSTYKDFTILVDATGFGLDAAQLAHALAAEGIETRHYYAPPVHATRAYRTHTRIDGELRATLGAASRVVTLPLWVDMTEEHISRVRDALVRIRCYLAGRGNEQWEANTQ